jgi:hypothetical protein
LEELERAEPRPEVPAMIAVLAATLGSDKPSYLSAPITTGYRFAQWLAGAGAHYDCGDPVWVAERRTHVVLPNIDDAQRFARHLRAGGRVVIDPTELEDQPGWTQLDYRTLWARVVRRFAGEIICFDGWQFSSGCSYEFLVAVKAGMPVKDDKLELISYERGQALIAEAIRTLRRLGANTDFLEQVNVLLSQKVLHLA